MQIYIRASILSASLIATVTCIGQQSPTSTTDKPTDACPISITNINPTGSDSFGHGLTSGNAHANDGRMFVLKVKNASGKDIRGMKFQAAYFDAMEDATDIPVSWEWTDPLKLGTEKSFRWENSWRAESKVGWKVRLTKVLFDDGSRWEPAPGQTCSAEYWRDKRHKP